MDTDICYVDMSMSCYLHLSWHECEPVQNHSNTLVGGFKHECYCPFHMWDIILPIDELIVFNMVIAPPTSILSSFIFHERLWGNYDSSFCHQQIQPLIGLKSMPQWHQLQEAVSKMKGAKLQDILFGWCFRTCFYVSIYWEFHHPNWRRHIFQRGRYTTNQRISCEFYPLVN